MSDPIRNLWRMMREKFGPENETLLYSQEQIDEFKYRDRRLSEPCPHLLKLWLDNNEKIRIGETISVQCSTCGGYFAGAFKGYCELGVNGEDKLWILCKVCGMKSYHPKDIEEKFCGNCCRFYE